MSNLSGEIKCHQHDVKKNNCHNGKVLSRKNNHGAKLKNSYDKTWRGRSETEYNQRECFALAI